MNTLKTIIDSKLTDKHDLSCFECESEDLNDFLKNDALKQQEEKLNLTKLITCDGEIIGFVSLLTDAIKLKIINDNAVKITIKGKLNITENNMIPAVKIGRFAIAKKYSGRGLGSHILKSIILNIKDIAETDVGLRFIVVEGYASVYNFYVEHNHFHSLKKDENELKELDKIIKHSPERTFYLYLDLKN